MTTNDKPVANAHFNPLLNGDSEEIALRLVRILDEPAFSFHGARRSAPDATSEPAASEKAVIQEQI
jgi:hypothetical protein